jgi:hypothetical protein
MTDILPDFLPIGAIANCVGTAIVTTFESVGVVSLSVTASFDVTESIIEMIWVSAWEFTTAIGNNLSKWFLSKTTITTTRLMPSAV